MSNYTKLIKRKFEFDGDEVTVTMRRLKRKDALKIIPHCGEPDEDGKVRMDLTDSMEFMNIASETLVKYITTVTGLIDNDGGDVSIEDAFGEEAEAYFMNLSAEIMGSLMEASFLKPKEEKKSDKQPENILKESIQDTTLKSAASESSSGLTPSPAVTGTDQTESLG